MLYRIGCFLYRTIICFVQNHMQLCTEKNVLLVMSKKYINENKNQCTYSSS